MHFTLVALASALTFATSTLSQTIDPASVPLSTRDAWCLSQITQCPLICLQEEGNSAATYTNDCDPETLSYSCTCSNGVSPNATEYSQTIPYYICTEYNTQCQANCGFDNSCAAACVQNHPCGAQNPTRVNTSTITTTSTTSAGAGASTASDGSAVYNGFGGDATATAAAEGSSSAAFRVSPAMGEVFGTTLFLASIMMGMGLVL